MLFSSKKMGMLCRIIVTTERNSEKNDKKSNITYLKVTKKQHHNTLATKSTTKEGKAVKFSHVLLYKHSHL